MAVHRTLVPSTNTSPQNTIYVSSKLFKFLYENQPAGGSRLYFNEDNDLKYSIACVRKNKLLICEVEQVCVMCVL